jgi:hypothetical protein
MTILAPERSPWTSLVPSSPAVLGIGYTIDFVRTPVQSFIPKVIDFGFERNRMVDQEVQDLLGNGAISECACV